MDLTIAENLLYSTAKLTSSYKGETISTGTGFFMMFSFQDVYIPVIITNKHVLNGSSEVAVICHIAEHGKPSGRHLPVVIDNLPDLVIPHPDANVDLCAVIFGPCINYLKNSGVDLFFRPLHPELIPPEGDWDFFDAIEEVTMIGCPRGIYDEVNNFPIVRRGITASSLAKKYNGKDEFMVDMACFPGSSGSPIFLYDRHGYFDRKENTQVFGRSRLQLVGILYAGPLVTNDGRIILAQEPRVAVDSMMHLGNALRSTAVLNIQEEIKRRFLQRQKG